MVVRIRCIHCDHRFRETEAVLGRSIPCPACGQWLKVEPGLTLSGEATFARVSAGEPPKPQPKAPKPKRQDEPSLWRNPALWIGLATMAALVIVFISVLGHEPEPFEASSPERETPEETTIPADVASEKRPTADEPAEPPDSSAASPSETAGEPGPQPSGAPSEQPDESAPAAQAEATGESPAAQPTEDEPPADEAPTSTEPRTPQAEPGPEPETDAESQVAPPTEDKQAKTGLSAGDIFKRSAPAVVQIVVRDQNLKAIGQGSGFLVSSDGVVVTNHHVVNNAAFATVVLPSKATLFAEGVLALDEDADLAVLKVNGSGLPYLKLAAGNAFPEVGSRVYAIGSPRGLANSLSEGLVSGLRDQGGDLKFIQTTTPFSKGSSGGPLLDADGRVVGVTTIVGVGPDVQNLNFAVPARKVRRILARADGSQPQPLASAGGQPLDGQASAELQEAWQAIADERWSEAVDVIQRLRRREPENPQVYFVLGFLHVRLGNNDLALEAFENQVRLAPNQATGHVGLGMAYYGLQRYREAISSLRKAVRAAPNFWPAHTWLGMSLYASGRYRESVDACKEAIRLRPDAALAYYQLGLSYVALRDRRQATQAYRTLLQLDPGMAAELRTKLYGP
ncbi:MAG: trypsin-like peptidase domain-containing protein [Phycisphaerae bacterium]